MLNIYIAQTQTWIPTPHFSIGQESESKTVTESVSGNVNEPLPWGLCASQPCRGGRTARLVSASCGYALCPVVQDYCSWSSGLNYLLQQTPLITETKVTEKKVSKLRKHQINIQYYWFCRGVTLIPRSLICVKPPRSLLKLTVAHSNVLDQGEGFTVKVIASYTNRCSLRIGMQLHDR